MSNWLVGSSFAITVLLAFAPVAGSQTTQQPGAGSTPSDLSGFWSRPGFYGEITDAAVNGKKVVPPMQPWAEQTYKAYRRAEAEPVPADFLDDQGRNKVEMALDPNWVGCVPRGFPRVYFGRTAFEIYQVPGRVIQIFEADRIARIIYTDGRAQPEGYPSTFMGHSTAHWDGDTLAVDTIGLRPAHETWLDGVGHPHTEALRVTERLRRVKQDTLEIELLFDDPKAYTKPWGGKTVFSLRPGWELMESHLCEDRIREVIVPKIHHIIQQLSGSE